MTSIHSVISRVDQVTPPVGCNQFDQMLDSYSKYVGLPKIDTSQIVAPFSDVFGIPTFIGMEVEVENIHKDIPLPEFWQMKNDGSLRNGGKEFFSIPLEPKHQMQATAILWALMKKLTPAHQPDFSWRTSIQPHLNVLDLTEDELRSLLLLGFVFDPLFFALAGKEREDSVFCTPLYLCEAGARLGKYLRKKASLRDVAFGWPKYTSINLCRMYSMDPEHAALGTVEFRHLGGTNNLLKVLTWQSLILRLFHASVAVPYAEWVERIKQLNTTGAYAELAAQVFTPGVLSKMKINNYPALLFDSVARAKELFAVTPKLQPDVTKSAMVKVASKLLIQRRGVIKKTVKKTVQLGAPEEFLPGTVITFDTAEQSF